MALKVLDPPEESVELEARLLREARILAQLEHPGIVPVHDAGTLADGRVFYAMKYVQGRRLDQHLPDLPSLPDRLRVFQRICDAVAFAHSLGVLHRDLKPQNVMLGAFGEVLVMDWGVAKVLRTARTEEANRGDDAERGDVEVTVTGQTSHGTILGTPGFIAPEQARGDMDLIDQRADVYSLGAVLFFLMTRRAPSDEASEDGKPRRSASGIRKPFVTASPEFPRPLAAICAQAMAPLPAQRYSTVGELAADVSRYIDGRPVSAYPESLMARVDRLYQKHRTAVLLVLTYLLVRALLIFFGRR